MKYPVRNGIKGKSAFIRERTRYLLAHVWCVEAVTEGKIQTRPPGHPEHLYLLEAVSRGWISKIDQVTINKTGWEAAAAFLKR